MELDSPSEDITEEEMIASQLPVTGGSEEEDEPMTLDLSIRKVTDEEKENIDPMVDVDDEAEIASEADDHTPEHSPMCSPPFKKRRVEEAEPNETEVETNWKLPNGLVVTFIKAAPPPETKNKEEKKEDQEGRKVAVSEKKSALTTENAAALWFPTAEVRKAADSEALVPPGEEKATKEEGKEKEDVTVITTAVTTMAFI